MNLLTQLLPNHAENHPKTATRQGKLSHRMSGWVAILIGAMVCFHSYNALAAASVVLPWYDTIPSSYADGNLGATGSGNVAWAGGTANTAIQVSSDPANALSYDGLALPPSGSKSVTVVTTGTAGNKGVSFANQSTAGTTVYCSFLIKVTSAIPSGNFIIAALHSSQQSFSVTPSMAIVLNGNTSKLGVSIGSNNPLGTSATALVAGSTYFVVAGYTINPGTTDDTVSLWVNPDSATFGTATPPTPDVDHVGNSSKTDQAINSFWLNAYANLGQNIAFDEFRIGTNWADVAPFGGCAPPAVSSNPSNQLASVGGVATFSVAATGSVLNYQWQAQPSGGGGWNDVGSNAPAYTTPTLIAGDNGNQYRCLVSSGCTNLTATSAVAVLTVADPSGKLFRSYQSGNWNDTNTWEQSTGGNVWGTATAVPNSTSSNITIQASHVVAITSTTTADQLTVLANGELDLSAPLTVSASGAQADLTVFGTLKLMDVAGLTVTANGPLRFENGGKFSSALHTGFTIPAATWATNSICEIKPAAAGAFVPAGLGQTFGNFVWNWPAQSGSVIIAGALTNVAGDFEITPGTASAGGFCFGKKPDSGSDSLTVNVGGAIKVHGTLTGGNFLLGTGGTEAGTYLIKTGKGLIVDSGARVDGGNPGATSGNVTLQFTGNSEFTLNGVNLANSNSISYVVDNGAVLALNSRVGVGAVRSFTVNGALDFKTNTVIVNGSLVNNGTLIGNGTSALTSGAGSISYGGTLNLSNNLPAFAGGESFQLFAAGAYSGSFANIQPASPGNGLSWDTTQLATSGTLLVTGTLTTPFVITSNHLVGNQLTISGTGGTASSGFTIVTATNLGTPLGSWATWATGTCDGSGNFSVTANINPADAQSYYRVQMP